MDRSTFLQNLLNAFVKDKEINQGDYAPKWRGVRSYSVALQDHSGACNQERRHQGKQECARRIRQIQRMNMK